MKPTKEENHSQENSTRKLEHKDAYVGRKDTKTADTIPKEIEEKILKENWKEIEKLAQDNNKITLASWVVLYQKQNSDFVKKLKEDGCYNRYTGAKDYCNDCKFCNLVNELAKEFGIKQVGEK